MTVEPLALLVAIAAVGAGLATLTVALFVWLRADIQNMGRELRGEIRRLDDRVGKVEQGQARLEGLLDGGRDAPFGRTRPSAAE